jgi:GWxTD domain-containing protein
MKIILVLLFCTMQAKAQVFTKQDTIEALYSAFESADEKSLMLEAKIIDLYKFKRTDFDNRITAKKQCIYYIINYWYDQFGIDFGKARTAYLQDIQAVQHYYTLAKFPGYMTDRGRIYLTYGKPTEIVEEKNKNNVKPYQVWQLNNLENGQMKALCVFYDEHLNGNMKLIHSTIRGEISNTNWKNEIYSKDSPTMKQEFNERFDDRKQREDF